MGAWNKGEGLVPPLYLPMQTAADCRAQTANLNDKIVLRRPARNLLPAETPLFRRLTAEELAIEEAATGEETPDTPAYMPGVRARPERSLERNLLISQHWRSRAGCSTRVSVLPE